jgi:8-oxo-dGTP diphosphatase
MEKFQKVGVSAFIVVNDKVLVVQRSEHESFLSGYWELPGGNVEFGEDPKDALMRECSEEVSLNVEVGRPYWIFSYISNDGTRHTIDITYSCKLLSGDIVLSNEHTEYRWISKNEVDQLTFSDEMKKSITDGFRLNF